MANERDEVVVITGASRGLGRGMAERMGALGYRLGLCARSDCTLDGAVAERVDVTDAEAVEGFARAVVDRFGKIDLWINNAGVLDPIRFVRDLSTRELLDHLAVNVAGVMHGTQTFARHLRDAGREGVLINISSGAALKGYAGWGAYCSGKAAVDRLSECAALEEERMRVHAVAPGVVDTDMQAKIRSLTEKEFPMVEKFLALKRDDAFNSPAFVARHLLAIAFDPAARPDAVVVRLPNEK
jgi:NAD(P)-dependent dehydrogenase (short-subunit alcohol dehydrogenase family)